MLDPKRKPLYGCLAADAAPPTFSEPPMLHLPGTGKNGPHTLQIPAKVAAKSFLLIGASQSGKTNVMKTIMDQILPTLGPDDAAFVLDSKLDFITAFRKPRDPILGIDLPGIPGARQNFYLEVLADGTDADAVSNNCEQLTSRIFAGMEHTSQPFFPIAAKRVFHSFLELGAGIQARQPDRAKHYHNGSIRNYFRKASPEALNRFIAASGNPGELRSYLGDFTSNQALGVLGELNATLSKYLQGPWGEAGDFSIRRFIRERGGRTLYLHYSLKDGYSRSELYGLDADLAFRELLSHPEEKPRGKVYFFFDELKLLGKGAPEMLETVVNFGISQGLGGVFVGIQSVAQLNELYGEDGASALLAGFGNLIAFHPNDADTRELILDRAGTLNTVTAIPTSGGNHLHIEQSPVADPWDLARLDVGQALVCLANKAPFYFQFDKFERRDSK